MPNSYSYSIKTPDGSKTLAFMKKRVKEEGGFTSIVMICDQEFADEFGHDGPLNEWFDGYIQFGDLRDYKRVYNKHAITSKEDGRYMGWFDEDEIMIEDPELAAQMHSAWEHDSMYPMSHEDGPSLEPTTKPTVLDMVDWLFNQDIVNFDYIS
jgi:hypothetical protein